MSPRRRAGVAASDGQLRDQLLLQRCSNACDGGARTLFGAVAIVLSVAASCSGSVLARPLLRAYPPALIAGTTNLLGGAMLVSGALSFETGAVASLGASWSAAVWLSWAYLVLFGSVGGFTIYLPLIRDWGPSRAGAYAFVSPVIAGVLGMLVFGERVGMAEAAGTILMLSAAMLALRERRGAPSIPVVFADPAARRVRVMARIAYITPVILELEWRHPAAKDRRLGASDRAIQAVFCRSPRRKSGYASVSCRRRPRAAIARRSVTGSAIRPDLRVRGSCGPDAAGVGRGWPASADAQWNANTGTRRMRNVSRLTRTTVSAKSMAFSSMSRAPMRQKNREQVRDNPKGPTRTCSQFMHEAYSTTCWGA